MAWFAGKCFPKEFGGKHFPEAVKNLEISLFADYIKFDPQTFNRYIYFIFNIYFQFHLLKFYFYINFGPYFYNCYLFFSYHFLLKFFIYQIWPSFFWLLLILFEIIYEMLIIIILISSFFFYFLDLIYIILIIIYFIWDNLWNYFFFQFHSHSTF